MIWVIAILCVLSAVCGLIRIIVGPSAMDRLLALDFVSVIGLGGTGIVHAATGSDLVLDIGLLMALMGFVTVLTAARIMERTERSE